MEKKY